MSRGNGCKLSVYCSLRELFFFGKGVFFFAGLINTWSELHRDDLPKLHPQTLLCLQAVREKKTLKVMRFLYFNFHIWKRGRKHTVNECPCSKTRKTYTGTVNMIHKFIIQSQWDTQVHFVFLQKKNIFMNAQRPKHSSENKEQDEPQYNDLLSFSPACSCSHPPTPSSPCIPFPTSASPLLVCLSGRWGRASGSEVNSREIHKAKV